MFVQEVGDIVDEASNNNKRTLRGLILDCGRVESICSTRNERRPTALPAYDRQFLKIWGPLQILLCLTKPLELHGKLTLLHFIFREDFQVTSKAELVADGNEPLGRIILIPPDSVTVVHGELVVEVMVTLSDGDKCGDEVIPGSVFVIERSFTKPVSQGVDAERRL